MTEWLEVVDEVAFKRVPNGYQMWDAGAHLFGRQQRYVMDEARKEEILTALRQIRVMRAALLVLIIVGMVGLVISAPFETSTGPRYALLAGAAAAGPFIVLGLTELLSLRRLRALAADLPRAEVPMTRREIMRARMGRIIDVTSYRQLAIFALMFSIVAALDLREHGLHGATTVLAAMAAAYLVLAVLKAFRRDPTAVALD